MRINVTESKNFENVSPRKSCEETRGGKGRDAESRFVGRSWSPRRPQLEAGAGRPYRCVAAAGIGCPEPPDTPSFLTGAVELAAFGHVEDFPIDREQDARRARPVVLAQLLQAEVPFLHAW